ncbi:MAG: acetolactate synthase small subunit [Acidimicrobiales bacterium]
MGSATIRHHLLSVLVENKAGVLARVANLFSRRGYNIFSLAVAPTDDERFSRITICVDVESAPLEQVVKQLDKLVNVVEITELDPTEAIEAELMLITLEADRESRSQVIQLVDVFDGRIVDVSPDSLTIMLAGTPSDLDHFEDLVGPYGIAGLQRTGRVALHKLDRSRGRLHTVTGIAASSGKASIK